MKTSNHKKKIDVLTPTTTVESNVLHRAEQDALTWLMQKTPCKISSCVLIYIALFGNIIVATSFVLGAYLHSNYLLVSIVGYIINRLSHSFTVRLENDQNELRKCSEFLYGFTMDFISVIMISIGFMIYVGSPFFLLGLLLLLLYSLKKVISLLYGIIGGKSFYLEIMNSNKLKLLISLMILTEFVFSWSIIYSAIFLIALFAVTNLVNLKRLFAFVGDKDINEDGEKCYGTEIENTR